ncbi:MAG: hypothetical protein EXQ93_02755 [Alphaproteobacteria bacterium]|nr:hypothetical protein [Alphaproteobacteria bacterium]
MVRKGRAGLGWEARRLKRARTFLVRLLAALTAGLVVVAVGALWLVATGPVSLGFLAPYVEGALVARDGAYRITFADTVLAWGGWSRTLDLRVLDVRLLAADDSLLGQAPEISVTLSVRALLQGRLAPTRIDLLKPQLRLIRDENGRIGLGGDLPQTAREGNMLQALLAALSDPPAQASPFEFLSRVGIAEATVWIEDRITGAEWFAPRLDATLVRRTAGISAELNLIVALIGGAVEFTATADYSDVPGVLTLAAAFADLNLIGLGISVPTLAEFGTLDAKLNGNVAALVTREGVISRIDFDLASGPGHFESKLWKGPVGFESAAMRGTVLDALRTLRIDDFFFVQDGFSGEASGLFTFAPEGLGFVVDANVVDVPAERLDALWPITLAPMTRNWVMTNVHRGMISRGTVHMSARPGEVPHMPHQGNVDLKFSFANAAITYLEGQPDLVDARGSARLTLQTFDATVDAGKIGLLTVAEGDVHIDAIDTVAPSMVVDFVASGLTAEALRILSLEPMDLNLPTGFGGVMAARTRLALPISDNIRPGQVKYAAAANMRDLTIPTGMPRLALTGGSLSLRADAGGVEVQGTIAASGTPFSIDARIPVQPGQLILVTATGTLNDDARRRLGFDTGAMIQGPIGAVAHLELTAGTQSALRAATFDLDLANARIDLPGMAWDKAVAQPGSVTLVLEPAPDGTLHFPSVTIQTPAFGAGGQLTVDSAAGTAAGAAAVNGYEFAILWTGANAAAVGHISASARGDEALLAAFGYPLAPWLQGPIGIGLEVDLAGIEPGATRVLLDLRDATVATPVYDKPAGRDAFAELGLAPDAERTYRLRSFAVTGAGLAASGTIDPALAADGGWQRIQLARLVLGETNVTAIIDRAAGGALQVTAQGARLDIRAMIAGKPADAAPVAVTPLPLPPIRLAGRFDRVLVSEDRTLLNASARAVYQDGAWRSLDAEAELPTGSKVTVAIADAADGQALTVNAVDAGAFFSTFGLFQGAAGGTMEVTGTIREGSNGRTLDGVLRAHNFHLSRAPAMVQLLSAASFIGFVEQLQGAGIPFSELRSPFRLSAAGFTLGESRATGASLGITFEGTVDWQRNTMNMNGTIVPAYMINSLLGRIPLLGDLFIGEGLFAFNYSVAGSPSAPVINVNPLSALAPGLLGRLIFGTGQ